MFSSRKVIRFTAAVAPAATMIASRAVYAAAAPPANITAGINNATQNSGFTTTPLAGIFGTIVNVLLEVVGAIAVIMLVVGGLQYALSGGDSKRVESAKNTILYAIVGLVIASLALAIINFVTGRI